MPSPAGNSSPLREWTSKMVALALILFTGWMAYEPRPDDSEAAALAKQFQFRRTSLDDVREEQVKAQQPLLAPRFQHLESYLTAFLPTGAALTDLDGNGYPDEACTTDGFSGKVRIHQLPVQDRPLQTWELELPPMLFGPKSSTSSGCLPGDYNEDGLMDLLVYFWGRTPVVYLNQGGELSSESFRRVELVSPPTRWYTQSMAQGDVNGDGKLDLIVGNYFPSDAKILNDSSIGDSKMNKGMGGAFNGAINRLLLAGEVENGEPRFVEAEGAFASRELGGRQWTLVTAVTDLDGDLLPEVFFLNDHGTDRILHNRSRDATLEFFALQNERDFTTPKSSILGRDDYHAMGVDFADLNQDGHLDWLVSNFGADYLFHQSHFAWINSGDPQDRQLYEAGQAPFQDESEKLGLARTSGVPWDVRCVDFNNDGQLEIFRSVGFMRGTVNRWAELTEIALINDLVFQYPEAWHKFGPEDTIVPELKANTFSVLHDGRYTDIGVELDMFEPGASRGVASADINRDGKMDFLVTNQRASSTLYLNESATGAFIGLDVELVYDSTAPSSITVSTAERPMARKSRPAIGAAVQLKLPDGKAVAGVVDGGSGYGGKKGHGLHFGLGRDEVSDEYDLDIQWRDLQGEIHGASIKVTPGWQTIWLGGTAAVLKEPVGAAPRTNASQ